MANVPGANRPPKSRWGNRNVVIHALKMARPRSPLLLAVLLFLLPAICFSQPGGKSSGGGPPSGAAPGGGGTSCDMCGASATYSEAITDDATSGLKKRTITSSGCPNHYSVCGAKPGISVCGQSAGAEGTGTEAREQGKTIEIPAQPVIATATTDIECSLGAVGIALNGVSIYAGAVDGQCTQIDVTSDTSEWTGFDMCSGHAQNTGDYQ